MPPYKRSLVVSLAQLHLTDVTLLLFVLRFLVDSANFLQQHISAEGLFRKAGSVQRQKVLKVKT